MTEHRELRMYDGRDRIGLVIERNSVCDAFDIHGIYIGTFKTVKAAVAAINSSLPLHVCDTSGRRDGSGG